MLTTGKSDWRLRNQQKYLQRASLLHRPFQSCDGRDHEHCAFCWAKFMLDDQPNALQSGYCTPDLRHWICDQCFRDFRENFAWQILSEGMAHQPNDDENDYAGA